MLQRLKILFLSLVVVIAVFLTARTTYLELIPPREEPSGSILVWHSWPEEDTPILLDVVQRYIDLHPDAKIALSRVPPEDLLTRFEEAAGIGFGPDLLLAPSDYILPLAQSDLIMHVVINEMVRDRFLPASLDALHYNGQLYGLPLTLHTSGLYYNRSIVEEPARTVDELLAAAQSGVEIGLSPSFENAYWGLRAFGGRLFNEEGRAILDQGGFANWLNWLSLAQDIPAFVLSNDQSALRTLFIEGQLGYLIDRSTAWDELSAGLDPSRIGVLPLPTGPTGSPAPLLGVNALLFSAASSSPQQVLAQDLAAFLTNVEQQTTFMRQTERIPANTRVRINARLSPVVASFAEQARASVALPLSDQINDIVRLGNEAYTRVLEGVVTPAEAAADATAAVNESLGFAPTAGDGYTCLSVGDFTLWHTWVNDQAAALDEIIAAFSVDCPNVYVRSQFVAEVEIAARLRNVAAGDRPDLVLLPHTTLSALIADTIVRPVGPLLTDSQIVAEPDVLQRFRPLALNAFRSGERLYGLPMAVRTQALIYNNALVDVPARSMSDLLLQTEGGARLGVTLDFADLYWGLAAFGAPPVTAGVPIALDETSLTAWFDWLLRAEQNDALVLGADAAALNQRFVDGTIAYRIASAEVAAEVAAASGPGAVDVTTLPSGPQGESAPLAVVHGFAVTSIDETALPALVEFMRYATAASAQRNLVDIATALPANATVDVTAHPILAAYAEQLATAILMSTLPNMTNLIAFGGDGYVWVRSGVLPPAEAAQEVINLIQQATGASPSSAEALTCAGAGRVQLWTVATDERFSAALTELGSRFSAACPDIAVTHRVAADRAEALDAVRALAEDEIGLILGSGDWASDLAAGADTATTADQLAASSLDAVFAPVDGFVDAAFLRTILPTALDSVRADGRLFALPLSVDTTAIYVNRSRIQSTPATLADLLSEAQIGRRVALLSENTQALWGIGAFGGSPNPIPNAAGTPIAPAIWPSESGLTEWFRWLVQAQRTPGMILGEDEARSLSLFTAGRLAYFSGNAHLLPELRAALGDAVLDVMLIPTGPAGAATPLLHSQALYFPVGPFGATVDGAAQQAAVTYAAYLLSAEAQRVLMTEADRVPVNRLVDMSSRPRIARFAAQASTAVPYPTPRGQSFLAALRTVTAQLLNGNLTPESAAARVLALTAQAEER
ncbi:extracellular solute-binding protein [bacterium]|nr:extracellular solute-binding protein [bacterium]